MKVLVSGSHLVAIAFSRHWVEAYFAGPAVVSARVSVCACASIGLCVCADLMNLGVKEPLLMHRFVPFTFELPANILNREVKVLHKVHAPTRADF